MNESRRKNSSEPGLTASVSPTFTAERETLSFRWVPRLDGPPSYIRNSGVSGASEAVVLFSACIPIHIFCCVANGLKKNKNELGTTK